MLSMALAAWQLQSPTSVSIGESTLEVQIAPGSLDVSEDQILAWIRKAGSAVARYYGRFPVPVARIAVHPAEGESGVFHGTTWGRNPPFTRISVGQHVTPEQLRRDWMMTHELIHVAFPDVDEDHHWIEEGTATYVEPIARVLIGDLEPPSVWGDMMKSMRQGQPGSFDEGLDRTHTWGRTYWGGALFCLLADVHIRQETGDCKGLRDGLQAIVRAGGTIDHHWPLTKAFAIADQATETHVLSRLYSEMANRAVAVDLNALWAKLGVSDAGGVVSFDNGAPLAAVRRSITSDTN